jgi:uncharacterized LabA/DUF88 family protein
MKRQRVYAFIDSQNLNLGTSKNIYKQGKIIYCGWKLDYKKFRKYLVDKFRVRKFFLFIGYIRSNRKLYRSLRRWGYNVIFKPTIKDKRGKVKGNIDAELVLYCARIEYDRYDKAVIVSGDGDFYCLHKFLADNKKLAAILIPNSKSESKLLNKFRKYKVYIEFERGKLELKK